MTRSITPGQHSLARLNVAVIGAGRIGTEVIRNLGLMGIGRIDVFENDRAAADPLRSRYAVFDGDFWDTLTLSRLQQYDFAVCTVATDEARKRVNSKCLLANVNLVHVVADDGLACVSVYPFGARDDAACAECAISPVVPVPLPLAYLRLSVEDSSSDFATADAANVATASVAGAIAAALIARVAAGAHGAIARRATLDATLGQGATVELHRDTHCPSCSGLQRPVPIVTTRNRWNVSSAVAATCPEVFDQRLELSDAIAGVAQESCCLRELSTRFQGGPVPAKFALTQVGGRTICLAFEDGVTDAVLAPTRTASGSHPLK